MHILLPVWCLSLSFRHLDGSQHLHKCVYLLTEFVMKSIMCMSACLYSIGEFLTFCKFKLQCEYSTEVCCKKKSFGAQVSK